MMLKMNKYRKALFYDYLCLILCVFAIFALLYSSATVSQEAFDGSKVIAAPDESGDMTEIYPETNHSRTPDFEGSGLQQKDTGVKAVKY